MREGPHHVGDASKRARLLIRGLLTLRQAWGIAFTGWTPDVIGHHDTISSWDVLIAWHCRAAAELILSLLPPN